MRGICLIEPLFYSTIEGRKTMMRRKETSNYKIGEVLYLKEPYHIFDEEGDVCPYKCLYKYGKEDFLTQEEHNAVVTEILKLKAWKNKLFIPESAARYFIKITGVRKERLQDISDEDCIAEGIFLDYIETDYFHYYDDENRYYCSECERKGRDRLLEEVLTDRERFGFENTDDEEWLRNKLDGYSMDDDHDSAKTCDICGKTLSAYSNGNPKELFFDKREAFEALFDSINGKGKKSVWDQNPCVKVYDYKICDKDGND